MCPPPWPLVRARQIHAPIVRMHVRTTRAKSGLSSPRCGLVLAPLTRTQSCRTPLARTTRVRTCVARTRAACRLWRLPSPQKRQLSPRPLLPTPDLPPRQHFHARFALPPCPHARFRPFLSPFRRLIPSPHPILALDALFPQRVEHGHAALPAPLAQPRHVAHSRTPRARQRLWISHHHHDVLSAGNAFARL